MYFEKLIPIYFLISCVLARTRSQNIPWALDLSSQQSKFLSGKSKRVPLKNKSSSSLQRYESVADFDHSIFIPVTSSINVMRPYYNFKSSYVKPSTFTKDYHYQPYIPEQSSSLSIVSKPPYPASVEKLNRNTNLLRPDRMKKKQFLEPCDGRENILSDFGIISLIIGAVSTLIGFTIDLFLTLKGNAISVISIILSLLFSIPNAIISFLGISNQFTYLLGNGLNVLGFATTFFSTFSVDVGNLGLFTGLFFEFLGIIGLVISVLSSFPELFDDFIDFGDLFGFGDELHTFINNYGCHNPFYDTDDDVPLDFI